MTETHAPFSGFSVRDPAATLAFYRDVLGLAVEDAGNGMTRIGLGGDAFVLAYPKGGGHVPATFTVLNFPSDDVTRTVADLTAKGVAFERYPGMPQDDDGVMRGNGPDIAWFLDPSGNILSVVQA